MLELIFRGAMAALEVVGWLVVVVIVPVPVVVGVIWVLETVVPKWVVAVPVGVTTVTGDVAVDAPVVAVETVEVAPVLAALGPMLKEPVVAYTFVMSPMLTASIVYPAPTGTEGSRRVI